MTESYKASCLCGTVAFEVEEFAEHAAHCHCRMCRKFHGAEYATYASVPRRAFRWLSGREDTNEYTAANGTVRTFCGCCGSSLLFQSPNADPGIVEVALAVFDSEVPVVPDAHIFLAYAASWTAITDALPQFPESREAGSAGSAE